MAIHETVNHFVQSPTWTSDVSLSMDQLPTLLWTLSNSQSDNFGLLYQLWTWKKNARKSPLQWSSLNIFGGRSGRRHILYHAVVVWPIKFQIFWRDRVIRDGMINFRFDSEPFSALHKTRSGSLDHGKCGKRTSSIELGFEISFLFSSTLFFTTQHWVKKWANWCVYVGTE